MGTSLARLSRVVFKRAQVNAFFVPSDEWRRPSDYVAHRTRLFEDGVINQETGRRDRKPLARDQALFVAQFAHACNAMWDDEQQLAEGALTMRERRCFNILLMGQGGSGKTALIQDIVLPSLDFLFPPDGRGEPRSLIACAKWSQAENISTDTHKATTAHQAGKIGVQSFRNAAMLPKDKKSALKDMWSHRMCLILEEVSMLSPELYNMLLYRSYHGRSELTELPEAEYDQPGGAFGRMPLVIYLGDFLQLKPIGAGVSLISDLKDLQARGELKHRGVEGDWPAEWQSAQRLFCRTPLCFELQASNRFKDPRLRELMNFIRAPAKQLPPAIERYWQAIQLKDKDPRLREERFQTGHMIAIYWETVARWMVMCAKRDAAALKTPLFLLPAADVSKPLMPMDVAKKLMNKANPKHTGNMHGMWPVHLGMRVRLLEALQLKEGLVKDAEGEIVHIAVNPLDQAAYDSALACGAGEVYLRHLPLGIWLRMDKYTSAPFCAELRASGAAPDGTSAQHLVFLQPTTSEEFCFREYKVKRTGFAASHGRVITSTACQGRTFRAGVVIDCGRHEGGPTAKSDEDWWLELYVMLSRATRLDDLLLVRQPPASFLLQGPPATLKKQLRMFARRTEACRAQATALARELGFTEFFH